MLLQGNQQASNMLSGQVTDAYNNALASYSDADRDALLGTQEPVLVQEY